jgi:two-component system chemotaxis sensor kinase CheA
MDMDNGTDSMLDVFLFETDDLLEHLDDILLACEKNKAFDQDSINEIFRIMHTIKGSSAMMQFNSLTVIAHKMEDLFAVVREKGVAKEYIESLIDMMFRAGDFLKSEVDKVRSGQPLTTDIGNLEQEINDFLKKISGAAPAPEAAPAAAPAVSSSAVAASPAPADLAAAGDLLKVETEKGFPYAARVFLDEEAQMDNLRAFMLTGELRDVVPEFDYSPKDIDTNPATAAVIVRDGFFLFFRTEEDLKKAIPVIENFTYTKSYSEITPPAPQQKTAGPASSSTANVPRAEQQHTPVKQSLINVNLSKLDSLMDLMGEIVITESMVTSNPALQAAGLDNNFAKASRQLRKLTDELQEIVMSIRMVPISTVFQKMNRIVRDMNKKLGKNAKLVLVGEETEVDKTIVDSISDPIMHLVRNSMDHGIETPEERLRAGKPEEGTVTLTAQNTGGDILISVEDDGEGIDCAKVLSKAEKKGLLTKPASEYSDQEIFQFLLMPGFSTNDVVTEFSGRGVGMDVVKDNVEKIGGEVTITSTPGKGTKTVFKIPLTLAIINGMKVSVGDTMFTIPIKNILQSFKATKESIMYDTDMREIIKVRENYYPLIRLHKAYDLDTEVTEIEDGIVILVGTHDTSFCIFADALLGEHQVVVKSLPTYLQQFRARKSGIDGCAILGDGSISLILNVQNLYRN